MSSWNPVKSFTGAVRSFGRSVRKAIPREIRRPGQEIIRPALREIGFGPPEIPEMPGAPKSPSDPLSKAIAAGPPTIDEARLRAQEADAFRRKRGRRASILTGPEGVGPTQAVAQKTLIGT